MYNTYGDFMLNKLECIQLLKQDVIPALGCTEPVCVALCLAHASKVLDEEILSIDCEVNIGISVIFPTQDYNTNYKFKC